MCTLYTDPEEKNLVELSLDTSIESFTEKHKVLLFIYTQVIVLLIYMNLCKDSFTFLIYIDKSYSFGLESGANVRLTCTNVITEVCSSFLLIL